MGCCTECSECGSDIRGRRRTSNNRLLDIGIEALWLAQASCCCRGVLTIVKILPTHFSVFCDAPLPRLAADKCPAHGTCDHTASHKQNGGHEHNPSSPFEMRNEQQDVDEESQERHEQCGEK